MSFVGVKAEQDVDFVARPLLGLVDLVVFHEGLGKVADGGKVGSSLMIGRVEGHPGMLVEPAADHLAILGPFVVGIERGVNADEAFAVVVDEGHHVVLLAVVHVQLAGGAGKDEQVEVVEIFGVAAEGFSW